MATKTAKKTTAASTADFTFAVSSTPPVNIKKGTGRKKSDLRLAIEALKVGQWLGREDGKGFPSESKGRLRGMVSSARTSMKKEGKEGNEDASFSLVTSTDDEVYITRVK